MNSINFDGQLGFPLTRNTMDYLQSMVQFNNQLSKIGGDSYILSGCVTTGTNVSSGFIVIKGELLPFAGGTIQSTVYIKTTTRDVTQNSQTWTQVYKDRQVVFGLGAEQQDWSIFKQIPTNGDLGASLIDLQNQLDALRGEPLGFTKIFSGDPSLIGLGAYTNYALCDGRLLLKSDYPDLYAIIGDLHGVGDATHFHLPNLSGQFIAGLHPTNTDYSVIAQKGGQSKSKLDISELPPHKHIVPWGDKANGSPNFTPPWGLSNYNRDQNFGSGVSDSDNSYPYTSPMLYDNSGAEVSQKPFENRPPFYVMAYVMRLK